MQDKIINSIEVIDWLKYQYKQELNPFITSVQLCQDDNDVWLLITKNKETYLGKLTQQETINLNFICDNPSDNPMEFDVPVFTPQKDVFENAVILFTDKTTLINTIPLFDK